MLNIFVDFKNNLFTIYMFSTLNSKIKQYLDIIYDLAYYQHSKQCSNNTGKLYRSHII